jgi:hypothetical protein
MWRLVNFGCSYQINASGKALDSKRCPWGGSDEGFPRGWAADYVNNTMIPELKDLVTRYKPHYLCEPVNFASQASRTLCLGRVLW